MEPSAESEARAAFSSDPRNREAKPRHLVVLGAVGIGKSCFTVRAMYQTFVDDFLDPTLSDVYRLPYPIGEYHNFETVLEVLDFASRDSVEFALSLTARDARVAILGFAINDRSSFDEIWSDWVPNMCNLWGVDSLDGRVVLVGFKSDVDEADRKVTVEEAEELAAKIGDSVAYRECSAKEYDAAVISITQDINMSGVFDAAMACSVWAAVSADAKPSKKMCRVM